MQSELTVDSLAQEIRRVDGSNSLGAGALAEALMPFLTAALSDKQAVEVSCIACEGRPSAGNNPCAVCGRSALVDVPAVEPVGYTTEWHLNEVRECRIGNIVPAGTMRPENEIPLYTQPPLREGEDNAEVERLRGLLDVALDALDSYADPTGYTDNNGEQLAPDEVVHQGLLAKETAANLRAALAATRSGSATTAKGVSE